MSTDTHRSDDFKSWEVKLFTTEKLKSLSDGVGAKVASHNVTVGTHEQIDGSIDIEPLSQRALFTQSVADVGETGGAIGFDGFLERGDKLVE